jgi:hypothetical protein
MKAIHRWADIAAIPFFFLLTLYFYQIQNKTIFEWVLFAFSFSGLFADILFTYMFLSKK